MRKDMKRRKMPKVKQSIVHRGTAFVHMCCPISGNLETTMLKESFIKLCIKNQKRGSAQWGNADMSTRDSCMYCEIGPLVKEGEPFEPPKHITFITIEEV